MSQSFTHLHVHSHYSLLDGAAKIEDMVEKAVADKQPALGLTDHGNMHGVIEFYKACKKRGINPVIGSELYMAHDSRYERPKRKGKLDDTGGEAEGGRKAYYHLTTLAENNIGYKNLIQLSSRAFLEGYYMKPKIDWELLQDHHEGLIVTTGCLGGLVLQAILNGKDDEALMTAGRLQDIFGKDNLFIELQDHGLKEQKQTNPKLIELSKTLGAPLLAVNDSHYVNRQDATIHDTLLCIQTGALVSDEKRFKFEGEEHYIKTSAEMRELFSETPEACDNTLWIAERANVEMEFGIPHLPVFSLPGEYDNDYDYLHDLTIEGAKKRWGQSSDSTMDRILFELKVIRDMGFSSYFLIIWDLIKYARENSIKTGPGRGSAAGSAVSFCLDITDIDPIKYDLLFERFLNPSRISMPDIDLDFDSRYRDQMIRYVADKYGHDQVAQIVTFSTIKARAAVRDAARVLGYPFSVGDKAAKAMPPLVMGKDTPLSECFDPQSKRYDTAKDFRDLCESDPDVAAAVQVAKGLEGLKRGDGIHAAGVVIAPQAITQYLPVQRKPKPDQDPSEAPMVTQFEMNTVADDLGLLKMDFLGLRNLDVIADTVKLVETNHGIVLDMNNVPLDNTSTFDLLRKGDTIGVFQLEGTQMRNLVRSLAPTEFEDLGALVALYRPGPMAANMHYDYADRKNARQSISYIHPDAEEILSDTYGLMIYQEKLMRIAQKFAGYSLAEADNLRKACGKKIKSMIQKEKGKFIEGCVNSGYGRELGEEWFSIIEPFADYAFPKAHAICYGFISYQTAFLKANYPIEYFTCLLSSVKDKPEKTAIYLNECRRMGIEVLVPDINKSKLDFSVGDSEILCGLSAVRNVGENVVELILQERTSSGTFKDFYDFCDRVNLSALNKRTVESLIKAGSFESLGYTRKGLLESFDGIVEQALARRKQENVGQYDLFSSLEDYSSNDLQPISLDEFSELENLSLEKEMLGLYISGHPLMYVMHILEAEDTNKISEVKESESDMFCTVSGLISRLEVKTTRAAEKMCTLTLEDLDSTIEVVVFPKQFKNLSSTLKEGAIIVVGGWLDIAEDSAKIKAQSIKALEVNYEAMPILIRCAPESLGQVKMKLIESPGNLEVYLKVDEDIVKLPNEYNSNKSILKKLIDL